MCKRPLFSYIMTTLVTNPNGEWRDLPSKYGYKRKFYDYGQYAPFYSAYELAKNKQRQFIKSIDEYEKLKEREPNYIYQTLPCGQCIECRLNYSRQWASRIVCESAFSCGSLFVTLTYDDEHIHLGSKGNFTLDYSDFHKFIKDLRRYCFYHYGIKGIRYFAAGEYGDKSLRPHYHLCLFNLPSQVMDDLEFYSTNFNGDSLFNSPLLSRIWSKGFVVCGELNFKSAAYVGRYVLKKVKGPKSEVYYSALGIVPERSFISNRPGLGKNFYEKFKDEIYINDEIFLPRVGKVNPSSYFDKLYGFDNPETMEIIKARRRSFADSSLRYKMSESDVSYAQLLDSEEVNLLARIKALRRKV